ncbi:MAG TPA: VOC family protein [Acidobacteriota bacterium]|nr:VOC family protein [Acidobacteriota bacterium]
MTKQNHSFTPEGWHSVTPRMVVHGVRELVEFIKKVFGATGDFRSDSPVNLHIGDSIIMISEAGVRKPSPAFLYVYVANADETYQRAIKAGAKSIERPTDTPYGDRRAMVEDQWGNVWQIATFRAN